MLNHVLRRFGLLPELFPNQYKRTYSNMTKLNGHLKKVIINNQLLTLIPNKFSDINPRYTLFIDTKTILSLNTLSQSWYFQKQNFKSKYVDSKKFLGYKSLA